MPSNMASQSLAFVSYRVATDPDFIQELPRQIEARKFDNGQTMTEEEAAALINFLGQQNPARQEGAESSYSETQGQWIG
jgi:hypothetical protein